MTGTADWLRTRTPEAPPELRDALMHGVPQRLTADGLRLVDGGEGDRAAVLMDASDAALERVLSAGVEGRASALDLLSADAYVTYAFEAAADQAARVPALADEAMRRISAIADRHFAADDALRAGRAE